MNTKGVIDRLLAFITRALSPSVAATRSWTQATLATIVSPPFQTCFSPILSAFISSSFSPPTPPLRTKTPAPMSVRVVPSSILPCIRPVPPVCVPFPAPRSVLSRVPLTTPPPTPPFSVSLPTPAPAPLLPPPTPLVIIASPRSFTLAAPPLSTPSFTGCSSAYGCNIPLLAHFNGIRTACVPHRHRQSQGARDSILLRLLYPLQLLLSLARLPLLIGLV